MVTGTAYDRNKDWDGVEELELIEADERLPWLESGDEDEEYGSGFDTGRLVMLGLIALLTLAMIVAGIWLVSNSGLVDEPEADGSIIAAPSEPYKTRPDDEGGKTFQGTGDVSFAVGEGQAREGRLADRTAEAPKPSIATSLDAGDDPATAADQPASAGVGVQVGAYSRRDQAEAGWATLLRQTEALSGVSHRIVEGQADIGRVYRLQAVAGDRASASRLCEALKADGLACQVK